MWEVAIKISDAIKSELNLGQWQKEFSVKRVYLPALEREKIQGTIVSILIEDIERVEETRKTTVYTYRFIVGIQSPIDPDDVEAIDEMIQFAEQMFAYLAGIPHLKEFSDARLVGGEHRVVYSPETLERHQVFTSVMDFEYRIRKEN